MQRANPWKDVPEWMLRRLWASRGFRRRTLMSVDGKSVKILSPGRANTDGGPDFTGARIRVEGVTYVGDVELHRELSGWRGHSHHLDPRYNKVVLHVAASGAPHGAETLTQSGRRVPILLLTAHPPAPSPAAMKRLAQDGEPGRLRSLKCRRLNKGLEPALIRAWMERLGRKRFELRVRMFRERLEELAEEESRAVCEPAPAYGEVPFGVSPADLPPPASPSGRSRTAQRHIWDQLLYEGVLESLGFSKNREPFLKLARVVPIRFLAGIARNGRPLTAVEAALFGAAGLLPEPARGMDRASSVRLRRMRALWHRFRRVHTGAILHPAEWQYFRLRPENFPPLRLAGAARIAVQMSAGGLFEAILRIAGNGKTSGRETFSTLRSMLVVPTTGFWSSHYRIGARAASRVAHLIGIDRAGEIVTNAVLPVCVLYARTCGDRRAGRGALAAYREGRVQGDNSILRLVRSELVRGKFRIDTPLLVQGALQLYKRLCIDERCGACALGRMVFGR